MRREASTTWAPAPARALAKRAPRPLEAPVTMAIFPSKFTSMPTLTPVLVCGGTDDYVGI